MTGTLGIIKHARITHAHHALLVHGLFFLVVTRDRKLGQLDLNGFTRVLGHCSIQTGDGGIGLIVGLHPHKPYTATLTVGI